METVLFITDLHIGAQIAKSAGIYERARIHGWRIVEIERGRTERPLSDFFDTWHPVGCIAECSNLARAPEMPPSGVPIVFLDPDPETLTRPCHAVMSDAGAIAALAAKELVEAKSASFLFAGWCTKSSWSLSRAEAFAKILEKQGRSCTILDAPWNEELEFQTRLARSLEKMPKPVGVFAASDYVAKQVTVAFDIAGMQSPRDGAIVGVDNDELICENTLPTLSSIAIDFKHAGRLAADLLAELIAKPDMKPRTAHFGPTACYRRQSTRMVNSNDWRIIKIVERIRRDACTGLTVSDIVAEAKLSRRLVEKRFRAATGRSMLEEIVDVRFSQACRLLRDPAIPIGWIATQCGWKSDSYMKRLFRSRTGLSPRAWRKSVLT